MHTRLVLSRSGAPTSAALMLSPRHVRHREPVPALSGEQGTWGQSGFWTLNEGRKIFSAEVGCFESGNGRKIGPF